MDTSWLYWIYPAFFALVAAGVIGSFYQEKRRREALAKAALRLGCTFAPRADELTSEYGGLPLFSRGHSRRATNVLRGGGGDRPDAAFDYRYTIGSGKSSTTYRQTVAVFRLTGAALPAFTMAPEHMLHRLGELFGYRDIDFEHQEGFSRAYFLRGKDEAAVRRLFQPALPAFFQQEQGWSVEGGAEQLVVYRAGQRAKPEDLQRFMDTAVRMAGLFKSGEFRGASG